MTKHHISTSGKVVRCRATKRPCTRQHVAGPKQERDTFMREALTHAQQVTHARLRPADLTERVGIANALHGAYNALLSDEEREVLRGFAAFDSREMNRYHYKPEFRAYMDEDNPYAYPSYWQDRDLFEDAEGRRLYLADLHRRIRVLDTALTKGRLAAPQTVYRGIQEAAETLDIDKEFAVGARITSVGYWSTSTNPAVALSFANITAEGTEHSRTAVLYKMETRAGAALGDLARYTVEDEILLPRNHAFEVLGVTRQRANRYDTKLVFTEETKAMVDAGLQAPLIMQKRDEVGPVLVVHLAEVAD